MDGEQSSRSSAMTPRASHLHVVEFDDNGEVHETKCPDCRKRLDELAGLQRDIRGWALRYRELERDKAVEARESPLWPVAELLFKAWRKHCGRGRTPWTVDRFWLCEPFLVSARFGATLEDRVKREAKAIKGISYDAYSAPRKNGTVKTFNDWDLLHRSTDKWEEFAAKAPIGWEPVLSAPMLMAIGAAEARLQAQRKASKQ